MYIFIYQVNICTWIGEILQIRFFIWNRIYMCIILYILQELYFCQIIYVTYSNFLVKYINPRKIFPGIYIKLTGWRLFFWMFFDIIFQNDTGSYMIRWWFFYMICIHPYICLTGTTSLVVSYDWYIYIYW